MRAKSHDLFIDLSLFRNVAVALALVAGSSCSRAPSQPPTDTTGGNTPTPGAGGGAPDGGSPVGTSSCGFVTSPTSFALPTIVGAPTAPFPSMSGQTACLSGKSTLTSTLADMNGDGILDLLVTSTCDDATVGVDVWLVYLGSASGFAATATRFTLPPQSAAGCATVSLFDSNGDLLPDYVITSLCTDATVGSSRWLVYPSSGTGFSDTASSFAVPPGASAGAFATTGATKASCATGQDEPAFQLFDINGDGQLDFVVTQSCNDPSIGTTSWSVYLGSASGASQTATPFALPTSPPVTAGAFVTTSGTLSCSGTVSTPQFGLLDFNADGKFDLVVTQACNQPSVGSTAWLYFENTGSGFAPSTTIALPDVPGAPTSSFPTLGAAGTCTNDTGTPSYDVLDMNGDGLPDILVTRDCPDRLTGSSYWQLFANTGTGFAASYEAFTLPSVLGATSTAPVGLSGTSQCTLSPPRPTYTTTYLGQASPDLVVTTDCSDATVGATHWLVYPASCR